MADLLQAIFGLPDWIMPGAAGLLMVGGVVITATALVQALPETTAKGEAGEIPTDWQIDPASIVSSLRAGLLR
jgi:hypothetical protein